VPDLTKIDMDLSVIIPVYNEEENISLLYERMTKVMQDTGVTYELIFINDGSHDRSLELVKDLATQHQEVKYIDFSRNFGHQVAVSAGLDRCTGEGVVIIDADLQDPPELIPEMYEKMKSGYEVVYARRKRRKGESWFKLITARVFYRLLARITTIDFPVDTGDFRIIHRKVVDILKEMPEQHKFLRGQISWIGFNQACIEYNRHERHGGETGYTLKKMLQLATDGITSFSDIPLRMVTWFGFITTLFAFIVMIYVLYSRFITEDYVQGWSSLMISILFIGGIQMIAIGIIGEYLSRMNANVRKRPLYIVRESNM
jgi:glycosyltransferase involved in cell wall biosynthesis